MWRDVWERIWAVYVLEWCRLLERLVSWTEFTMKSKYLWAIPQFVVYCPQIKNEFWKEKNKKPRI